MGEEQRRCGHSRGSLTLSLPQALVVPGQEKLNGGKPDRVLLMQLRKSHCLGLGGRWTLRAGKNPNKLCRNPHGRKKELTLEMCGKEQKSLGGLTSQ